MGRERQKKKNRSSISKARPKSNRTKAGKKKINFLGNETIAKNWDRKLTLSQNYKRLGLSNKLGGVTGGTEKKKNIAERKVEPTPRDSLAISRSQHDANLAVQEVHVERDPETGKITRVVREETDATPNPLNDPLNDVEDMEIDHGASRERPSTDVVAQLEREAEEEAESVKRRRPRQLSQREQEWVASLVEKHGEDIKAMVKDRKLNPMQQTEGDIGRRIKKWKSSQATTT